MKQYLDLLQELLDSGNPKGDRTGTGTLSKFGHQMRFDLSEGFPLLTTKRVNFKAVAAELMWMLKGDTNIKSLNDQGVHIWDAWADEKGDLGPIYGKQWRDTPVIKPFGVGRDWQQPDNIYFSNDSVDQLQVAVNLIKNNPNSRRIVVSSWNVTDLPDDMVSPQANVKAGKMALAPCHCLFQFYVANGRLSCQVYQRSADVFLGVPFNIASYALLTSMIANMARLEVGDLIWTGGDVHLYNNHVEQAKLQLSRQPKKLPKLYINNAMPDLWQYTAKDFVLVDYNPDEHIKAEISV